MIYGDRLEIERLENERDEALLVNEKLREALEWALYQYDNDPVGLGWREGDEQRYQEYRALLDA